jgi:hypothetical protein
MGEEQSGCWLGKDGDQKVAVGVGSVPANGPLTIGTNTATSAGGQWFGTDTNLYRSAAATLKTDGALVVGGTSVAVGSSPAVSGDIRLSPNSTINTTSGQLTLAIGGSGYLYFTAGQLTFENGTNMFFGTGTGTKIGTTGSSKMAFWGATPVVQNTGWSVTAGYTPAKTLNTTTTTLQNVATVVGTLVDALKAYGILG